MIKQLNFSTDKIVAIYLEAQEFNISTETVVFNACNIPLRYGNDLNANIQPWSSAILINTNIIAEKAILISVNDANDLESNCIESWTDYHDIDISFPKETTLFRSSQEAIGSTRFNPEHFAGTNYLSGETFSFEVRANLWFCPSNTDCQIHNQHDFLEIHTQVFGTGFMQMFGDQDEKSMNRNLILPKGNTHEPWFEFRKPTDIFYPFHRYLSESACIWMAIEFHPVTS